MDSTHRLRAWAENNAVDRTVNIFRDTNNGKWRVQVEIEAPFKFSQSSNWQDSLDKAAEIAIGYLETLGEDIPT